MFACLNVNGLARMKWRKMNWIGLGRIGKAICNRPKPKLFLQKNALKEKIEWTTGTYSNRLNDKFFENMFVSNLLWPLKFKNNDKGREKNIYWMGAENSCVFFAWNVLGKKHKMLQMFPFCACLLFLSWSFICRFQKIFDEKWSKKSLICQEKNSRSVLLKTIQ